MQEQTSNSSVRKILNSVREWIRRVFAPKLYHEDLRDIATIYRLKELDSSWTLINSDLKLWRYFDEIPSDSYELDDICRFRPLLLVHGYLSNHTTWNWMVNKLLKDGFRIIFAFEMDDYKKGFEHNMKHLSRVVNYILETEPIFKEIDIIGHSMGGAISKHFVKLYQDTSKVRLFLGLGSPLSGVFKIWKILAAVDYAYQTADDFTDTDGLLAQINEIITDETLYRLTQVNLIGSLRRYLGSDGFFKNKPVSDMINVVVSVPHFALNKDEKVYSIIKPYLMGQMWFYKIRLLFIQNTNMDLASDAASEITVSHTQTIDENKTAKDVVKFRFNFSVRGKRKEQYPRDSFVDVEKGSIYIPTNPIIMFAGSASYDEKEQIDIKAHITPGRVSMKESINLEFGTEPKQVELLTLVTPKKPYNNIIIQMAIYMYQLPIINL